MDVIDFEWSRCIDKYRLVTWDGASEATPRRGPWRKSRRPGAAIERVSGRFERYHPLEIPSLFAIFARDTPASANGMLDFCNLFGLPGGGRADMAKPRDWVKWTDVDLLLWHQAALRRAFNLYEKDDWSGLTKAFNSTEGVRFIRLELKQAPNGPLQWSFVPTDLIQAMWLQFARHACSGARLFRCENCNEPFTVGTGTGRRSTAKYCSNACKVAAFKARTEGRIKNA